MSSLGTETAFEVLAKAKALEAEGKDVVHLHIGAPDFETPPHIVEAGRKALADGWHKYTPAKGIPEVREAVCEDIARGRGATVHLARAAALACGLLAALRNPKGRWAWYARSLPCRAGYERVRDAQRRAKRLGSRRSDRTAFWTRISYPRESKFDRSDTTRGLI